MEGKLNIEAAMEEYFKNFTPEKLEALRRKRYEEDRACPENFSNWYPHILDSGLAYRTPLVSNQIFTYEEVNFLKKDELEGTVEWEKINKILEPTLSKMKPNTIYNIKNGCFSNKFDFQTCLATKENLARKLWEIDYVSSILDTGGYTELVVRELLPHTNSFERMTIYNGMPLRTEIRVFYNMEIRKMEYYVDYWDYEYCYNNLRNISDKIVFDYFHGKLAKDGVVNTAHKDLMGYVIDKLINEVVNSLKFDGELKGIWSIDFLYENNKFYLIDMARGFRSAYWDISKLSPRTRKEYENAKGE